MDDAGNLYIADALAPAVLKVDQAGELSIVAGNGEAGSAVDGPAVRSPLGDPYGVALDGAGNVYVSDYANSDLYRIGSDGALSSILRG